MKKYYSTGIIIIIILSVLLTSCSFDKAPNLAPDEALIEFIPKNPESYSGDSGYFHTLQSIERESDETQEIAILNGEVKDNSKKSSTNDYNFKITWVVDFEKITQTYTGSQLNESNFRDLILLKNPIEAGKSWTFTTLDASGEKQKVTGKIMRIENDGNVVVVRYSTKDGYYEERHLNKSRGVTDFIRLVTFKNESSITGYHIENSGVKPELSEVTTEIPEKEVKIPVAIYNLILGFEQAWSPYVKQENDDLLNFVAEASPALEKINAVARDATTAIEFQTYYPYEIEEEDIFTRVKVVETFMSADNQSVRNKVQYKISNIKGVIKIYDFESVK